MVRVLDIRPLVPGIWVYRRRSIGAGGSVGCDNDDGARWVQCVESAAIASATTAVRQTPRGAKDLGPRGCDDGRDGT